MLGPGQVEFVVEDRIARRVFVHVGGAVADPLARHEDRQLHVVLDLAHLERRRMAVPHQVVDQPAILADLLGAAAVAHARGLHDGGIVAHVVDDPDEAVIEHRQRLEEDFLERRRDRPQGRLRAAARLVDFGLLVGGEGHRVVVLRWPRTLWAAGGPFHGEMQAGPGLCLQKAARSAYIDRVGKPTMAINAAWHKRFGPGGSTRRLHHSPPLFRERESMGANQDRRAW